MPERPWYLIAVEMSMRAPKEWRPRGRSPLLDLRDKVVKIIQPCYDEYGMAGFFSILEAQLLQDGDAVFTVMFLRERAEDEAIARKHFPGLPLRKAFLAQLKLELEECVGKHTPLVFQYAKGPMYLTSKEMEDFIRPEEEPQRET